MFNHLWTCRNQCRLALPKAHEAVMTLACFGPEGIGHPIGVDPHLGGSQKLLLRALLQRTRTLLMNLAAQGKRVSLQPDSFSLTPCVGPHKGRQAGQCALIRTTGSGIGETMDRGYNAEVAASIACPSASLQRSPLGPSSMTASISPSARPPVRSRHLKSRSSRGPRLTGSHTNKPQAKPRIAESRVSTKKGPRTAPMMATMSTDSDRFRASCHA